MCIHRQRACTVCARHALAAQLERSRPGPTWVRFCRLSKGVWKPIVAEAPRAASNPAKPTPPTAKPTNSPTRGRAVMIGGAGSRGGTNSRLTNAPSRGRAVAIGGAK
jgi:hypothetical protein